MTAGVRFILQAAIDRRLYRGACIHTLRGNLEEERVYPLKASCVSRARPAIKIPLDPPRPLRVLCLERIFVIFLRARDKLRRVRETYSLR